jgi:hypothetical protein
VATTRADNDAISPTKAHNEVKATVGVREVTNGINEGIREVWRVVFHNNIFTEEHHVYQSPN